jgi:hypothetical protein
LGVVFALCGEASVLAGEIQKISLPKIERVERSDLYVLKVVKDPVAVLVLCPGCNGNGEDLIKQPVWQKFAAKHQLGLVGLSFASPVDQLQAGNGYYYAAQGSGDLLLQGIKQSFASDLPLLLYGFSGGAHFTSRFVEWKPERVKAWCAYSAAWWDEPKLTKIMPPGIVACGDYDGDRYGESLIYFKRGRVLGKPWLWISLPKIGHSVHGPLEQFVREYFSATLKFNARPNPQKDGIWLDIDSKKETEESVVTEMPSVTAWLPDKKLLPVWTNIHEP